MSRLKDIGYSPVLVGCAACSFTRKGGQAYKQWPVKVNARQIIFHAPVLHSFLTPNKSSQLECVCVCVVIVFVVPWRNESKNRKYNKNGSANFPAHFCGPLWEALATREGGGAVRGDDPVSVCKPCGEQQSMLQFLKLNMKSFTHTHTRTPCRRRHLKKWNYKMKFLNYIVADVTFAHLFFLAFIALN